MPLYVVLVRPRFPENIGAAARACANFGADGLLVVAPERLDWERMRAMATRVGEGVLDGMEVFQDLGEALRGFQRVVGSTARLGAFRKVHRTLRDVAPEIRDLAASSKVALLFGNEKWGLSNEELFFCDEVFTIPTAGGTSLNVAQAVVVTLYEVSSCRVRLKKPPLATFEEQMRMLSKVEELCRLVGYVPHDNRTLWMTSIRRFFSRLELTSREARMVMGFCSRVKRALLRGPLRNTS